MTFLYIRNVQEEKDTGALAQYLLCLEIWKDKRDSRTTLLKLGHKQFTESQGSFVGLRCVREVDSNTCSENAANVLQGSDPSRSFYSASVTLNSQVNIIVAVLFKTLPHSIANSRKSS